MSDVKIVYKNVGDLIPYGKNPRLNDSAVDAVANSIKEFGFKVPIVIDKDNVIVAGHTRLKASVKLGLSEVPCIVADDLNKEQINAFRLADNKTSELADWDFDMLTAELEEIGELNMELFGFENIDENPVLEDVSTSEPKGKLTDEFIIPPLSVFDTKQGYWQERKKMWKSLGIKSEIGRDAECLPTSIGEQYGRKPQNATSIFDPVLCEIIYKWFCPQGGKIYDCFAGGSVRGIVADYLNYDYHGIELRSEQVDANRKNAEEIGVNPKWYCDDSLNVDKYIEDESVDLIFSCPPYVDLEVYSDDERDISNMSFDDFSKTYKKIIDKACAKLKNDRFAVFVVGDVRDTNGFYRNFVDITKQNFNDNGLSTYNEAILLDML